MKRRPSRWPTTESGLACYLYTRDLTRAWRCTEALEDGIVGLTPASFPPKLRRLAVSRNRGSGAKGRNTGILDYTELKYVCIGGI